MATGDFREETYSFRFINLTPESASKLKQLIPAFDVGSRRPGVAVLDIDESTDLTQLLDFVGSEKCPRGTYGVWVSLVTSADNGGVSLPEYVLQLIWKAGCGIDFSFVACLADHEDR